MLSASLFRQMIIGGAAGAAYLLSHVRVPRGKRTWRRRRVVTQGGRGVGVELLVRGRQLAVAYRLGPQWAPWRAITTHVTWSESVGGEYRTCAQAKRAIVARLK